MASALLRGLGRACTAAQRLSILQPPPTLGETCRLARKPHCRAISTCRAVATAERDEASEIILYGEEAELYAKIFGDRQFEKEAEFLVEAFAKHAGRQPLSALELGCGPARHSAALAAQGLRVTAVDSSPQMIALAGRDADAAGAAVTFVEADIRSHVLPEGGVADLAFMLCGTLSHLLDNDAALACFSAVSRSLAPGGCLVLEMLHPEDIFGGTIDCGTAWDIDADKGQGALTVNYGIEGDEFDPLTQVLQRTVEVLEWTDPEGDNRKELLTDIVPQRFFTSQEIDLLARANGLKVVGCYGEMAVPFVDTDHEDSYALVMVLQKPQ